MVDKVLNEITALDSFTDPGGVTHTGALGGGGGGANTAWNVNGTLAPSHDTTLFTTELVDGENISVGTYTLLGGDTGPIAGGVNLVIATLDGNGGNTTQATIQQSDGTSTYIEESSNATYTNSTGGTQFVGIVVRNTNSTSVDLFSSGSVSIA